MSLFILDVIFWVIGIRGHIPGHDDFPSKPDKSSLTADTGGLMRFLAIVAAIVALLSLVLWAAVWLAIKSL